MIRALVITVVACSGSARPVLSNETTPPSRIEVRHAYGDDEYDRTCTVAGSTDLDLVAPVVAYLRRELPSSTLATTTVVHGIPGRPFEPPLGTNQYSLTIDPRSETGEVIVGYTKFANHYCLHVKQEGDKRTVIVRTRFTYIRAADF